MTDKDKHEFNAYLRACTDAQVEGVMDKEVRAKREDYVALVELELLRRNAPTARWRS